MLTEGMKGRQAIQGQVRRKKYFRVRSLSVRRFQFRKGKKFTTREVGVGKRKIGKELKLSVSKLTIL